MKKEVGVIDGDPLYDAQDIKIKNFAIGKANYESSNARIAVTFTNFAEQRTITFILKSGAAGWRINDIDYGHNRTLRGDFKESRP